MSEKREPLLMAYNQKIGYSFTLKIETETRVDTGLKYPDKTVVSASLGGNASSLEEASKEIELAKQTILKLLSEKVKIDES